MPRPPRQGPPPPLAAPQAVRAFRGALLEPTGEFIATKHFNERLVERQFDLTDVIQLRSQGGNSMQCAECARTLRRVRRDYPYRESGLSNVVLVQAPVYVCSRHGVQAVALRNVLAIHAEIARALLSRKRPLRGAEIRFLRKHRGWSQRELARRLGVSEVTVSRWETETAPTGPANQQRLHLLFTDPEAFAALQLTRPPRLKAVAPLRIKVHPQRRPVATSAAA